MKQSFKELYKTYYKRIYSCCFGILKDMGMAEDACQEAFIRAYEKIDTLKDKSKFGAWVTSIATNYAINMYNRNKRNISIGNTEMMDFIYRDTNIDEFNKLESKESIFNAIQRLKPREAELIILRYYWDLSEMEISELLGLPIGTVKSTLYRGRRKLHCYLSASDVGHN